jgi:NAD(P) transhydrogenase subunit alpha
MVKDGKLQLNLQDEIIRETMITNGGEVVNARVRDFFKMPALATAGGIAILGVIASALRLRAVNDCGLQRTPEEQYMGSNLIDALFVFMLAAFIGFEVIRHVSPLLHTPLMSLTNALDAIAVVGAIVLVGEKKSTFATVLGVIAIVAATSNVVGGFIITDRMLRMFKSSRPTKP